MAGTPGISFALGAWWYNNVAYPTEQAAIAAQTTGQQADSQADFNSGTMAQVPAYVAPSDGGRLETARALRAEQDRLAATPYGTPQSAGGTAQEWAITRTGAKSGANGGVAVPAGFVGRPLDAQGNPLGFAVSNNATGGAYSASIASQAGNASYAVGDPNAPSPTSPLTGALRTGVQSRIAQTGTPELAARATANAGPVPTTPGLLGGGTGGAGAGAGAGAITAEQAAANEQRAQQNMVLARLVEEANRTQQAPTVDSTGYNQSRAQSNATYNSLSALSGNNIGPVNAATGQRDQSRGALLGTADRLTSNASNDIGTINGATAQRDNSRSQVDQFLGGLQTASRNDVGDVMIDAGRYDQGRGTTADLIQRLIAEAERPEGPSEAEALMLNAQERAQRNAMGDAAGVAGGFRSQLVAQRRADGLGAQMSADAAAEMGALRAREETQYREDVRNALLGAGGLQGASSALDLELGRSDADRTAQIRQGNQTNTREALAAAAAQANAKLADDSRFATSDADRQADIQKANQLNALNSLLGAGGLQSNALTSDTQFSTSNADRQADISKANQANSLAAQIAASNSAQARLESDRALATDNANRLERVNAANAQNSIAALQAAGALATGTRGGDIQLSQGDQRAVVEMAIAAAQIDASKYGAQLQHAVGMANVEQRKAELQRLYDTDPTTVDKFLGALGPVASTLGLLGWKPLGK